MRKFYLKALIGVLFALLVGCQSNLLSSNTPFFGQSEQSLRTQVLEAFMNNPELANVPIHVETQQGTVLLTGYVKTIRQSDTAQAVASRVPGVQNVQNGLIVRK